VNRRAARLLVLLALLGAGVAWDRGWWRPELPSLGGGGGDGAGLTDTELRRGIAEHRRFLAAEAEIEAAFAETTRRYAGLMAAWPARVAALDDPGAQAQAHLRKRLAGLGPLELARLETVSVDRRHEDAARVRLALELGSADDRVLNGAIFELSLADLGTRWHSLSVVADREAQQLTAQGELDVLLLAVVE